MKFEMKVFQINLVSEIIELEFGFFEFGFRLQKFDVRFIEFEFGLL